MGFSLTKTIQLLGIPHGNLQMSIVPWNDQRLYRRHSVSAGAQPWVPGVQRLCQGQLALTHGARQAFASMVTLWGYLPVIGSGEALEPYASYTWNISWNIPANYTWYIQYQFYLDILYLDFWPHLTWYGGENTTGELWIANPGTSSFLKKMLTTLSKQFQASEHLCNGCLYQNIFICIPRISSWYCIILQQYKPTFSDQATMFLKLLEWWGMSTLGLFLPTPNGSGSCFDGRF